MSPKLSLAGLNSLRSALAVLSGATAVGISMVEDPADGGPALMQRTLLGVLWLYVGVTSVPWTNAARMSRFGAKFPLGAIAWGGYMAVVATWLGWSVVSHPAWRAAQSVAPQTASAPHVERTPDAPDASVGDRPPAPSLPPAPREQPVQVAPPPTDVPAPRTAEPDASVRLPDAPELDASAGPPDAAEPDAPVQPSETTDRDETPEGERRSRSRRHRSSDPDPDTETGALPPPVVYLERDPTPAPPSP